MSFSRKLAMLNCGSKGDEGGGEDARGNGWLFSDMPSDGRTMADRTRRIKIDPNGTRSSSPVSRPQHPCPPTPIIAPIPLRIHITHNVWRRERLPHRPQEVQEVSGFLLTRSDWRLTTKQDQARSVESQAHRRAARRLAGEHPPPA